MKARILTVLCGIGLAAGGSLAQETPAPQDPPQPPPPQERQAPPPPPQMQPQVDVSDAEVEKFAEIYVDVQETREDLTRELQEAQSPENAQEVQALMRNAITETIREHGWDVEKYNRVATAINSDPETREEALDIINNLST